MKEERIYSNIFYFRKISKIGGTEQFLYEIAKKYNDIDITIFYDEADSNQLKRLRHYIRCLKRRKGEKIICQRAFLNFNIDIIDDIESTENYYAFVFHANYDELEGYEPPIWNKKINHFIGVSDFATEKANEWLQRLGRKEKAERCYNPLTLEPKEKVLHLVSACRLDDKVKGGERTLKLIKALDRYCEKTGRHYIWHIFTNKSNRVELPSKNVVYMEPRVDVRPYIADSDYVLQLSNDMETYCYTINEALGYGVPIVTTPLSILNELPITDNEHIILNWDCSNVDEVVEEIFTKKNKSFKYNIPEDDWNNLLVNIESDYEEEKKMIFLIEATDKYEKTNTWDTELSVQKGIDKYKPKKGEQWKVDYERKEKLVEFGFATVVKEIKEEVIETAKKEINTEKAVKKTTKKNK